jgi:3-hydroxyacyl-CoA dehydrogenase/enoyl-CoA hydratase/3-hydroxybutyryl-CoA epimerase
MANPTATFETSLGTFTAEIYADQMPVTAGNFVKLATSDQAKDMIRTMWYHRTAVERCEGLPIAEQAGIRKVAILGAGMMGSGLAFVCAKAGYDVVLKDLKPEILEKAKAHCQEQANQAMKHKSAEERTQVLGRITYTVDLGPVAGSDLVIEAVIENDEIKAMVTREVEPSLAPNGIFASNTSAIPINHLAKASVAKDRFIGLHFFSPVEQMPLLEIIRGDATSQETLGRCVAFGKKIGKLPIVVGDGYGFFTSRTFAAYLMEGVELVAEGHDPVLVEWAARQVGMVVPPLKVFDEVSLRLGYHGIQQRERYTGEKVDAPGVRLLKRMVEEHGRLGKVEGKGFYDYQGKERRLWPGLKGLAEGTPARTGVDYLANRLVLVQVAETARCLEEGVLKSYRDAEVGAIFGIGFAPASGGPLAWMDRKGIPWVVAELEALAREVHPRYAPPAILKRMAAQGERFFEKV